MHYLIYFENSNHHYVNIDFTIDSISGESIVVHLPAWRPGRYELGNFAKNIQKWAAYDEKGQPLIHQKLTKDSWKVHCKGAKNVQIKYNYYAAELNAGSTYLDEHQLYINPVNCLLYVKERMEEACTVELKLPENYRVATGMKKDDKNPRQVILTASDFHELADSPLIASDTLQHNQFVLDGIEFNIWIQGECKPNWPKIICDFFIFINEHFVMMKEFPVQEYHFLFQLTPYAYHHGVEHLTSTAIVLGPSNEFVNKDWYDEFLGISSHELFHTWNIKSIRPIEMMPYDYSRENYSRLGFVAEGVTTYYGDFLLYRSGVFSDSDYFKTFDEQLQKHFDNFGRFNLSVADSSFDTWLDGYNPGVPNRKVSIYTEGCLIAFMTDILIRRQTENKKSLDDVMRTLYTDFGKKKIGYSENDYMAVIEGITGNSWKDFFAAFVYGTQSFEATIRESLDYLGLVLEVQASKKFHEAKLGFKVVEDGILSRVSSIFPNSIADKAGVSLNEKIVAINGIEIFDNLDTWANFYAQEHIKLTVIENKKFKEINLKPGKDIYYQKYSIKKLNNLSPEQRDNFIAWAGRNHPLNS
ncbi:MAG: M61 family metallopeptidase [Bacteroidetes bacterium]|nr:M61 family metallopeptidase [Bacteroidota bacterium]